MEMNKEIRDGERWMWRENKRTTTTKKPQDERDRVEGWRLAVVCVSEGRSVPVGSSVLLCCLFME